MNWKTWSRVLTGLLAAGLAGLWAVASAAAMETRAREAILVDIETGAVLLEKDADASMPTASMSKIMTSYLVFERLKEGRLSLDDEFLISEKAWRKGGSKMFVEVGKQVRVEDLLRGVIVQSGNDASIALAEGLSGSEEAFADEMTRTGREIGLQNSQFANATGWPDPNHWMTARDLALLAQRLIENFPEFYSYYSETEFTWNDIRQTNRNPLLYRSIGADGLKTGHTAEAGYGLTASATRDGRRLVLVINGMESVKARAEEAHRLISWGFREFDNYTLFGPGEVVDEAQVWLGESETVPLVVGDEDLTMTLSRRARRDMTVKVAYEGPVPAPITEGQEIATLVISSTDSDTIEVPLRAASSVAQLGAFGRLSAALKYLIFGAP